MKKFIAILILSIVYTISFAQKPSGVLEYNLRPYYPKNVKIGDTLGIVKILMFDSAYVRNATMFQFKAGAKFYDDFFIDSSLTIGARGVGFNGRNSLCVGSTNIASGDYAVAMGSSATASGNNSFALGGSIEATNSNSFAAGSGISSGAYSFMFGYNCISSGTASFTLGYEATASGNSSLAVGYYTKSKSYLESVFGRYNDTTNSTNATGWTLTDNLFTVGNGSNISRRNAFAIHKNGEALFDTNVTVGHTLHITALPTKRTTGDTILLLDGTEVKYATKVDSAAVSDKALQLGSSGNCVDAYIDSIYGCSPVVIDPYTKFDTSIYVTDTTISTALKSSFILGGNLTTSSLTFQTTTAVGATGADIVFIGGNAGGTEYLRLYNNADIGGVMLKANQTYSNYSLGYDANKNIAPGVSPTGRYNISIGTEAGLNDTTGSYNVNIGYRAGSLNYSGKENVYIGGNAGYSCIGDYNFMMGINSGYSATSASSNTIIGAYTASNAVLTGDENTVMGDKAGFNLAGGSTNTIIGRYAGYSLGSGGGNTIVGYNATNYNTTGSNNVLIGKETGYNATGFSSCVFLGYRAGYDEESSNRLYIANDRQKALIYGEFDNNKVAINDTTANATLDVRGDFLCTNLKTGYNKALTNNSVTTIFTVAFPSDSATYGNSIGGEIKYTDVVLGSDGRQSETGTISYSATEYNGTVTTNIAVDYQRESLSGGTLAVTPTITYAAGVWSIKINSNSSLTAPATNFTYQLINNNGGTVTKL